MALSARSAVSRRWLLPPLFLAPRLAHQSIAALVPNEAGPSSEVSAAGRLRKKVRTMPDDPLSLPKTRGPKAIEDTWTMRLGDSIWYMGLGVLAGATLWVIYEAQAGVRHRRAIGKKFFDQFKTPEERAAQFTSPQSPLSEQALGTPNERFPFIMEAGPREPGEMPREPPLLERMFAADSVEGRKKLAARREKMAREAQAKLDTRLRAEEDTS